jgi:pilus assembly protein Flp/PilA
MSYVTARKLDKSLRQNWSNIMIVKFKSFVANESGATAIEYALIASLIAIALVTILGSLGTKLSTEFSEVSSALK